MATPQCDERASAGHAAFAANGRVLVHAEPECVQAL